MKCILFVLAALFVLACAGNGRIELPAETVVDRDACLDISHCDTFAPYYRLGTDQQWGMVWWLISDQGHACVVNAETFTVTADRTRVRCNWRMKRP